jgi:arylsulfatase A-like enzyme
MHSTMEGMAARPMDFRSAPPRRRRSPAPGLVLGLAVLLCGCGGRRAPPHLVLVVLDAVHADHVSHLGYPRKTTPNLDRLAGEGATFTQALAPAPYTLASIPSILTGRLPDTHGLTRKGMGALPAGEVTIAEILKAAGYRTLGAVASANGSSAFGLDQGFDQFIELFQGEGGPGRVTIRRNDGAVHIPMADEFLPVMDEWLASTPEGVPHFLYLHILEPHTPYTPPGPFRDRYIDPSYAGPFNSGDGKILVDTVWGRASADAEDIRATIDLYDANLAWADHVLGRLIEKLREKGILDDALFVVTSDHGEAFWQHGQWGHNYQLYDEMLHVPLVVKFPEGRGPRGMRIDWMVSLLDLVPSICAWLEVEGSGQDLDGRSLSDLVSDPKKDYPDRALLMRSHHEIPHLALRTPHSKLILETRSEDPGEGKSLVHEVEYYDLRVDPGELDNLSPDLPPGEAARLDQLKALLQTLSSRQKSPQASLPEAQEALIKALGY